MCSSSDSVEYNLNKFIKIIFKELNIKDSCIKNTEMNISDKKKIICYIFESLLFSYGIILKIIIDEKTNNIEFNCF